MEDNGFRKVVHTDELFTQIISTKNLVAAWREFKSGKTSKIDVLTFAENAERHLVALHNDLQQGMYKHGSYTRFYVHDPKRRPIAKASVRDRVLHHAICRVLSPLLDKAFIFDSYASRKTKGTHAANTRLGEFAITVSRNNTRAVWFLKCDIRKFFDSVDHAVLLSLCARKISDPKLASLLEGIIRSFETRTNKGIPLGNLTSQLLANLYLDSLDQFVKRALRHQHYIRYTDDFVFLSHCRDELERILPLVRDFLCQELLLELHPEKIVFKRWDTGVDFLGYVHFPFFRLTRPKTVRRMFRKLEQRARVTDEDEQGVYALEQSKQSYLGVLSHAHAKKLGRVIRRTFRKRIDAGKVS